MKTLLQQIEDLCAQIRNSADTERSLAEAIGDELRRSDEALLNAIRTVAAEHEVRRWAITAELHALTAKAGSLPQPLTGRDTAMPNRSACATPPSGRPTISHYETGIAWSEKEVDFYLDGRTR